uniref:Uncharacterized protein n=1 Tax=viral metagenome TaxID=1070528 RepID=A0A6M3XK85_9ZZZZ
MDTKCNIDNCNIAKQQDIKVPLECLACDDNGYCAYKVACKIATEELEV